MTPVPNHTALAQNPIFVVGYPRSGTTLLQALLATQGDLLTFPETHFFSTVFAGNADFCETIDPIAANDVLDKIAKKSGIAFAADFLRTLPSHEDSAPIPVKEFFETLVAKLMSEAAEPSRCWLEKTPDHGLYMQHILRFYPDARFVGIIRNPFSAIHSRTKFFTSQADNLLSLLSTQWLKHVKAFEGFQAEHPQISRLIKYEDLTKDPEGLISNLCQFLEIEFEPEKLNNYQKKAESIVQPFEHWKQDVKSSMIFIRKDKPQSLFSTGEIMKIQSIVLLKMKQYGYKPEYPLLQKIYNLFM